jgi:hypothetical protein
MALSIGSQSAEAAMASFRVWKCISEQNGDVAAQKGKRPQKSPVTSAESQRIGSMDCHLAVEFWKYDALS